jgi:flagellar hook-associated protein 3 FlgL
MTISTVALTQTLANQLSEQVGSIAALQMQLASGHALSNPSDNPTAVIQVMALAGQASQLTSWQSNVATASSWLGTANNTANSVLAAMQSANALLLQAANQGAQSPTTYKGIGAQIQGIASNLLSLANTQFEGRAIFAGTSAAAQAFDVNGNYLGNNDVPTVVIGPGSASGETVGLSVPGTAMFGVGAANVFGALSAAATALLSGTPTSANISTAITTLGNVISAAQQASVTLGNASQQVSGASAQLTTQLAAIQANQANLQDVNVATVTTQLNSETNGYQAALWATSQAIPETLTKFIA